MLFEGLEGVKCDIIGHSEVQRTGEEFIELKIGIFFSKGDKKKGKQLVSEQKTRRKY